MVWLAVYKNNNLPLSEVWCGVWTVCIDGVDKLSVSARHRLAFLLSTRSRFFFAFQFSSERGVTIILSPSLLTLLQLGYLLSIDDESVNRRQFRSDCTPLLGRHGVEVGGGDRREVERTAARYVQCLYIAQAANSHSPGTVSWV